MEHTCPLVGSISPTSMLINVLFPAPLGPNKPRISPKKKKTTTQTLPMRSDKSKELGFFINKTAQKQESALQPFFTQRETCLVATFFIFLPRRNSFLSSNSLCRLLTRMAGIWQRKGTWRQIPANLQMGFFWGAARLFLREQGFTSSLLGLLRISLTRSLSAFTSSSSFSS